MGGQLMGHEDMFNFLVLIPERWLRLRGRPVPPQTFVPAVRGLTIVEARSALERCDLKLKLAGRRWTNSENLVTLQRPQAGTRVRRGTTVRVGISAEQKQ
jgi:beta-lactam-binding protein with PASTA domain